MISRLSSTRHLIRPLASGLFAIGLLLGCSSSSDEPESAQEEPPEPTAQCTSDRDCAADSFCTGVATCDPEHEESDDAGCVTIAPCDDSTEICVEASRSCEEICDVLPDADGDGSLSMVCGGDDCDDQDVNRYPGNQEVCDALHHDEDCDPNTFGYRDQDFDDVPDGMCCNEDGDELICGEDCNDSDSGVSPRVPEVCDGVDNDCDGKTDEGVTRSAYQDLDEDGYGDPTVPVVAACTETEFVADNGLDCDDTDPDFRPGAREVCDGLDNNCDGVFERDLDKDGHLDPGSLCAFEAGIGELPLDDCNDLSPSIFAGAEELCDGLDNDCDGQTDERAEADLLCGAREGALFGFCLERSCRLVACEPLFGDCNDTEGDGCETDLSQDAFNCGACGRACPLGETCSNGACGVPSFTDIAVGSDHACAVSENGGLACWGDNSSSQLGDRTQVDSKLMVTALALGDLTQVSAGSAHTCARSIDGSVSCWGDNLHGQVRSSLANVTPVPFDEGLSLVTDLVSREFNSCALIGGQSVCWGRAVTNGGEAVSPIALAWGQDVLSIDAQERRQCAILANEKAYCLGFNSEFLGNEHFEATDSCSVSLPNGGGTFSEFCTQTPIEISGGLTGLEQVSGSCVRDETHVWCWDNGNDLVEEMLDVSGESETLVGLSGYTEQGFCAWTASGKMHCATNHFPGPVPPPALLTEGVTDVSVGENAFCAIVHGVPLCAGSGLSTGRGNTPAPMLGVLPVQGAEPVTDIFQLGNETCVRLATGRVQCWGDGTTFPTLDDEWSEVTSLSAGNDFQCALDAVGDVYCRGDNSRGQLGSPGGSELRQVPLPGAAVQIESYSVGSCAVLTSGSVYCWGASSRGSFGSNAPENGSNIEPTEIAGVQHAVQVELGPTNACALTGLGEVYCWGEGVHGQLGDGTLQNSLTPVAAQLFADVTQIAVGHRYACALRLSGDVYCWGEGASIGHGDAIASSALPLQVTATSGVVELSGGATHVCVLDDGAAVTCWGANINGQIGAGWAATTAEDVSAPHTIANLQASQLSAGTATSCALDLEGRPVCWGENQEGQVSAFIPCEEVDIGGITGHYSISCVDPVFTIGF